MCAIHVVYAVYVASGVYAVSVVCAAYAIYDIDGQVYTQYPSFIDPQNIKSIMILKSISATNRYGGQGRGGAIVIKMKSSQ